MNQDMTIFEKPTCPECGTKAFGKLKVVKDDLGDNVGLKICEKCGHVLHDPRLWEAD